MKTANLISAMSCFSLSLLTGNGWLALIGFGNLFAAGVMLGIEIAETLSKTSVAGDE